ncbi:hypothetical protein D3C81_980730 [compost metagenome]
MNILLLPDNVPTATRQLYNSRYKILILGKMHEFSPLFNPIAFRSIKIIFISIQHSGISNFTLLLTPSQSLSIKITSISNTAIKVDTI